MAGSRRHRVTDGERRGKEKKGGQYSRGVVVSRETSSKNAMCDSRRQVAGSKQQAASEGVTSVGEEGEQ